MKFEASFMYLFGENLVADFFILFSIIINLAIINEVG